MLFLSSHVYLSFFQRPYRSDRRPAMKCTVLGEPRAIVVQALNVGAAVKPDNQLRNFLRLIAI